LANPKKLRELRKVKTSQRTFPKKWKVKGNLGKNLGTNQEEKEKGKT